MVAKVIVIGGLTDDQAWDALHFLSDVRDNSGSGIVVMVDEDNTHTISEIINSEREENNG